MNNFLIVDQAEVLVVVLGSLATVVVYQLLQISSYASRLARLSVKDKTAHNDAAQQKTETPAISRWFLYIAVGVLSFLAFLL